MNKGALPEYVSYGAAVPKIGILVFSKRCGNLDHIYSIGGVTLFFGAVALTHLGIGYFG